LPILSQDLTPILSDPDVNGFVGFKIDDGDGTYQFTNPDRRNYYTYDNGAADAAELIVTYDLPAVASTLILIRR
jgi:hypothetical protein